MTVALMKGLLIIVLIMGLGMLILRKNKYTLPDMPVGMIMPLTFPIEISNVGSANVSYKIQN